MNGNLTLKLLTVLSVIAGLVAGCVNKVQDDETGIIPPVELTESDMENFISVLPAILDFTDKYRSLLTSVQNDAEGEDDIFNAISNNKPLNVIVTNNGFETMDRFLDVYRNVNYAYYSLKTEFEDFSNQIRLLLDMLDYDIQELEVKMKDPSATVSERLEYKDKLKIKKYEKIVYSNVKLIANYEDRIDNIETLFNEGD